MSDRRRARIGRLHLLTDVVLQSRFSHEELARLGIAGGADTIQLREKGGSTRRMIEVAKSMAAVCRQAGVPLIVNDRIDVAIACDADGVHLGQSDFPIPLARKLLGKDKLIGGSAATLEEAQDLSCRRCGLHRFRPCVCDRLQRGRRPCERSRGC